MLTTLVGASDKTEAYNEYLVCLRRFSARVVIRNCSEWNCIIPSKAVNRTGTHTAETIYINDFVQNTETSQQKCSDADIIVIERNFFGDTLTMMEFWKVRGKSIVAIFDDAYDIMHPQNVTYSFWTNGEIKVKNEEGQEKIMYMKPKPLDQFRWGLQKVKGIQVPSVHLAKDWSKYNNTYYIHNYLDAEKYQDVKPLFPHPEEEIVVGWCGSMSHYSSFNDSGVLEALRAISRKYPQVKVLIGGDPRIFELLEVKNKVFQPYVPANQWAPLLKTFDIGLAPLSGEYDKRRSWIKALEWMAVKVPWAATKHPTYDELHDYGVMVENGYKNWVTALTEMIENYPKYKERAETTAYEYAMAQSSDKNIHKAIALYEQLIEQPYSVEGNFKAFIDNP